MRNLLYSILLAIAAIQGAAAQQSYDGRGDVYVGTWTGIITQETPEATRYFDMEMTVTPDAVADSTYAVSSHVMDGEYHAFMVGRAFRQNDGQLLVAESEIIRADSIPGMEWCVKRLQMMAHIETDEVHLRGEWSGDTSYGACQPGLMDLVRAMIRP